MANWNDLSGLNVTVMGLGLNGGGLASALFFLRRGARVTVTDLRDETFLAPSLEQLQGFTFRTVLGRHEEDDFRTADLVIKNPAVRLNNPYLSLARRVETDLSIFLSAVANPIFAITGSKGKSTTSSTLHHILKKVNPRARLGGNITVSPLTFIDELQKEDPVVLELSSWQLADLRGKGVLKPKVAVVTNLLWDHMNVYDKFDAYADDKAVIFSEQGKDDWSLVNVDQEWGLWFGKKAAGRLAVLSNQGRPDFKEAQARFWFETESVATTVGWAEKKGEEPQKIIEGELLVPGIPFRSNAMMAAATAFLAGLPSEIIREAVASFSGIEHRMERFLTWKGIEFYNDTAATIPEASVASFSSFQKPVRWITGGTDKNVNLNAYENLREQPAKLVLLQGSATERLIPILRAKGWDFSGPFNDFEKAIDETLRHARSGDIVLLSPGAASFEMFKNEFDRGNRFKQIVTEWTQREGS